LQASNAISGCVAVSIDIVVVGVGDRIELSFYIIGAGITTDSPLFVDIGNDSLVAYEANRTI